MEKSANKKWKESGTTLSFKDWIERENKKNESNGFFGFDSIITPKKNLDGLDDQQAPVSSANTTLGINNTVIIVSAVLIVGAIGVAIYKKLRK